jgi:hypothetical protein
MALVFSSIYWALAHPCPLRAPEDWHGGQIEAAAEYSKGLRRTLKLVSVFEDVHVGSWMYLKEEEAEEVRCWMYPASGDVLDQEYAAIGGLIGLKVLCNTCPACTTPELAGCVGHFIGKEPFDFSRLVDSLGVRSELNQCFPVTDPLWYGLWMEPVLPASGIKPLKELFTLLVARSQPFYDYEGFLAALTVAEEHGMALHVMRTPSGYLGGPTPYCSRCTAPLGVHGVEICRVCGKENPTEGQRVPPEWDFPELADKGSLREQLGEARFAHIVRLSLISQGAEETALDSLVEAVLRQEQEREGLKSLA